MTFTLPRPPERYDSEYERRRNLALQERETLSYQRGEDIELDRNARLIVRSPDGTRWKITVSDAGVVSATSL